MNYLLLTTALALSAVAAWYAISGLVAIFAAAVIPIIIMGSLLEASKLVVASWLYRNWKEIPFLMKSYFTTALVVLMLLTSMGIFGFLSKAHLDQSLNTGDNTLKIELIDNRIAREQKKIADTETVLKQLDGAVQALVDYDRIRGKDGAIAVRESQKDERTQLTAVIDDASDSISKLQEEKIVLDKEQLQLEAEVGPIKYIAAVIYGDEANTMLEEAVRIVILMIVGVFDPLAVLMIIAANWGFARRENAEEIVRDMPIVSDTTETETVPETEPTTTNEEVKDEVVVEEEITVEYKPNPSNRKKGRLLTEMDAQKPSRTKAFLDSVGAGSGIGIIEAEVQDLQSDLPFSIDETTK